LSGNLLLISSKPEDCLFAGEIATTAAMSLQTVADHRAAASIIAQQEISVVLADCSSEEQYQKLELAIQDTVGLFSDRINPNQFHFITSQGLEKSQYLIQSPLFGNFVLRRYGDVLAAGHQYGRIIKASLSERAFGLHQLLKPGSKIQVVKFQESTQKQQAVEAVKNYLIAAKFQPRMASVVANAVDELLMNAIFDAPIDELGRPLLASTSRKTYIKLEGKHTTEMHVGFDGEYIAVSAIDLFGSLDKAKLLNHISKIYRAEEYKLKTSVAGAGLGLATVFRSGGSFFFVSENRSKTEVTVFFKRTDSFKTFKDQFRFLSMQFYF